MPIFRRSAQLVAEPQVALDLRIRIPPNVHVDVPFGCAEHPMPWLSYPQLVADRLERGHSDGRIVRIGHRDEYVDDRLRGAKPGIAVEPMCSMRSAEVPSPRRIRSRSSANRLGHAES
jgi:hypothetical protein